MNWGGGGGEKLAEDIRKGAGGKGEGERWLRELERLRGEGKEDDEGKEDLIPKGEG